jgi:hypothetical protein
MSAGIMMWRLQGLLARLVDALLAVQAHYGGAALALALGLITLCCSMIRAWATPRREWRAAR